MTASWSFREMDQKQSRQGDIPTKHALDADVETFVREILQNANDAGPIDPSAPVRVEFEFHLLTGDDCEAFKTALGWDEGFERRLAAAAEEEQDLSIDQFLKRGPDELVLLRIHDYNTEGLSGEEDADESNYTALVRDMHRSNKTETEGGSHGVGGTVLWAFSGISTVLFNSTPVETNGRQPPRVIGRSYLPDHALDDQLYKGYGWYGKPDPDDPDGRHVSLWGSEARTAADRLQMGRTDESGTTATIVGFRQPGDPQPTEPEDLEHVAERIRRAASEYFWPAIHSGQLEVSVRTPSDTEPRRANSSDVEPFVEAYEAIGSEDGRLGHPGQTASSTIEFDLPERSDGTPAPKEGEATLGVRTAGPADSQRRNEVALFRGAGMVVRYVEMSDIAKRGTEFHAVLACGTARPVGDEKVNKHVEQFLRAAEPAAHNEWTGTPRLKNQYKGRRVGVVQDLQSKLLRDHLATLVTDDEDVEGTRLTDFERMFPLKKTGGSGFHTTTTSTPSTSNPLAREINDLDFDGTRWVCDVTLYPDEDRLADGWNAELWLTKIFEEGGDGERIPVSSIDVLGDVGDGVTTTIEDDGELTVRASEARDIRLRVQSVETGPPDPLSGRASRTGVRHKLVAGGADE